MLSSEHRAAAASAPVYLELIATNAATTHLEVIAELEDDKRKHRSLEERVLDLLAGGAVRTRANYATHWGQNERLGVAGVAGATRP